MDFCSGILNWIPHQVRDDRVKVRDDRARFARFFATAQNDEGEGAEINSA